MTEEKKEEGKFFVVENLQFSGIHIEHPNPRDGKDIVLGAWEARIIPKDEWEDSPYLLEQVDAERVKVYHSDKRPAPVPSLPPKAPTHPEDVRTIFRIALGDTEIEGESVPKMLINLSPNREGVYTGDAGANVDVTFLKERMFYILKWALWVLENFPRARFKNRIPLIKKRMEEIRKLP